MYWSNSRKRLPPATTLNDYRRKLIPVCRAIQTFPRNADALGIFLDLILFETNAELVDYLEYELLDDVDPSIYHLIHGIRDSIIGKPGTGASHFGLAFRGDNRTAIIINDIAFILGVDRDLINEAMRLLNVAVDVWSGAAKLYQTRGELLMKMDRHLDAVEELEYAADSIENDPRVYEVLADCYDALGRTDDASTQRARAEEVQQRLQEEFQQYFQSVSKQK